MKYIQSPLDQFEIRDLFSIDILNNIHLSLTNIGLYLIISSIIIYTLSILPTNNNKLVSNNWSLSNETMFATILGIVTSQINPTKGQIYFPFMYILFVFILVNNFIGLVKRCLLIYILIIIYLLNFYINKIYKLYSRISIPSFSILSISFISSKSSTSNTSYKSSIYSTSSTSSIPYKSHRSSTSNTPIYSNNSSKNSYNLNPYYITGFIDDEGCFSVSMYKDNRMDHGWQVKPIFSVNLHKKDIKILEAMQRTLGVGKLYKSGKDSVQFRVSSLKNLEVIINHLNLYPLITKKLTDFILFKACVNLIKNKKHLTLEGLQKIVNLKASINLGLSEKIKESFPNVEEVERPKVEDWEIKDPNWLRGFTEAEGSFQVIIHNSRQKKFISLRYSISQHIRDKVLIESFKNYLNCGLNNEPSGRK